ncbi:MAG: helix-turn-helix domain-containing protein [Actinomycetota bacterium]
MTVRRSRSEGPWISVSAAARALGVSPSTLRLWAAEGRVPHVRTAGGHRRFNPEALRQWMAEQPERAGRGARRTPSDLPVAPGLARALRAIADAASDLVEELVDGPAQVAFRRLPASERRAVVATWVDTLADAFERGSLKDGLERAEVYGQAHGLAGSSAEVTLGGSLALERAIERAMESGPVEIADAERHEAMVAMSRLTAKVAEAWARAGAGRGGPLPR